MKLKYDPADGYFSAYFEDEGDFIKMFNELNAAFPSFMGKGGNKKFTTIVKTMTKNQNTDKEPGQKPKQEQKQEQPEQTGQDEKTTQPNQSEQECTQAPAQKETSGNHQNNSIRFVTFGNTGESNKHEGIITIATYYTRKTNKAAYGVSFCSPKDVYHKEKGRILAVDRMNTINSNNIVTPLSKNYSGINGAILVDILAKRKYPSWAKETIMLNIVFSLDNLV